MDLSSGVDCYSFRFIGLLFEESRLSGRCFFVLQPSWLQLVPDSRDRDRVCPDRDAGIIFVHYS